MEMGLGVMQKRLWDNGISCPAPMGYIVKFGLHGKVGLGGVCESNHKNNCSWIIYKRKSGYDNSDKIWSCCWQMNTSKIIRNARCILVPPAGQRQNHIGCTSKKSWPCQFTMLCFTSVYLPNIRSFLVNNHIFETLSKWIVDIYGQIKWYKHLY